MIKNKYGKMLGISALSVLILIIMSLGINSIKLDIESASDPDSSSETALLDKSPLVQYDTPAGVSLPEATSRGSKTTFADGSSVKNVLFLKEGTNDTVQLKIPRYSEISSASMVIEGIKYDEPVAQNSTFFDTVSNTAWSGDMPNLPNQAPVNYQEDLFSDQDYIDVRVSDMIMKNTESDNQRLAYHHFSFSAAPMEFDSIDVLWKGGGFMNWPQGGQGRSGMNLYLYNDQRSAWDLIDSFSGGGFEVIGELKGTIFQNVGDYFDVNEKLHLIATVPTAMNISTTRISTDFVQIRFRGNISSNPENPSLNVGGQGEKEWEYVGEFTDVVTINDAHNFKARLQGFVDAADSGTDVVIALNLSSDAPGILRLKELSIEFNIILPNVAPELTGDIPGDRYSFPEDSDEGLALVDLYNYFNDDRGRENLTFMMIQNHIEVTAFVNTTSHSLDFHSIENYFGTKDFQIRATDVDGLFTDSNVFDVIVTPTNDPPFLVSFGDEPVNNEMIEIQALEGEQNNFDFSVWDIDGDSPDVSFGPDLDPFQIFSIIPSQENSSRGILSIEPEDEHIGTINFTLLIDDLNSSYGRDSLRREYNFSVEIINTNDAPELEEIGKMTASQDDWLNFTLVAHDVDIVHDDTETLVYCTNFSDYGIDVEKWDLDENTGNFSFLPDNSLVGVYRINFTVEDKEGKMNWTEMIIEIKNVNDPPLARPISVNIVDADDSTEKAENLTVNFTTTPADDPDLVWGDVLGYFWDFDDDGVFDDEGLSLEWTFGKAGNYTVILTVSDSGSPMLSSKENITIEVFAPPEPDSEDDDDDDVTGDGSTSGKQSEGMGAWLWILIGIITLIIILVLVFLFVFSGRKKHGKKGEADKQAAPAATSEPASVSVPVQTVNLNPDAATALPPPAPFTPPPAPFTPPPTPFGASPPAAIQAPLCPKCGQVSQFYSQYNCYWCGPCQDYVYKNS